MENLISSIKFIIHYRRDHSSGPHLRSEFIQRRPTEHRGGEDE